MRILKNIRKAIKSFEQSKYYGTDLVLMSICGFSLTILGAILVLSPSKYLSPKSDAQLAQTSVRIVRLDGRSGGSGVIYRSGTTQSWLLTNRHVCEVIQKGGRVETDSGSYFIRSYKMSERHDLCMLTVSANLGVNTKVAKEQPALYSAAIAVGHPKLLPAVVTRGHFTGKEIVQIISGIRKCTDKDIEDDPDNALLCLLIGGIPVLKTYEAQVATVLISGGSSGSPVFDESGRIAGLVFAGSGDISNALIVPQEDVSNFVNSEAREIEETFIDTKVELNAKALSGGPRDKEFDERISEVCVRPEARQDGVIKNICNAFKRDTVWIN